MRPLELAGFLIALLPLLACFGLLPITLGLASALLGVVVLVFSGLWQGPHWQLLPLYGGLALSIAAFLGYGNQQRWIRYTLAGIIACSLVLTAAFSYILPMFRLPQPTGPYAVGTRIIYLVDLHRMETHVKGSHRPRELMVQIWYPATPHGQHLASYRRWKETTKLSSYMAVLKTHSYLNAPVMAADHPYPVLLFNPAWQGNRTQNTWQMEDLASHGFIVVGIDHTYNSGPVAFPDGRVFSNMDTYDITDFRGVTMAEQIARGDAEANVQAGDDSFVLDFLSSADRDPSSLWFGRVNVDNAGVFGHSFGGAVAAQTAYLDPRVKAAINLDGWVFGDVPARGLNKPFMIMYEDYPVPTREDLESTDDVTRRYARMCVQDMAAMNSTMRRFGGYVLEIRGSRHNDFRDRAIYSPIRRLTEGGRIDPRLAHEIVEAYTLQFFSHYLLNKPVPLLTGTNSPYRDVKFENWYIKDEVTRGQ